MEIQENVEIQEYLKNVKNLKNEEKEENLENIGKQEISYSKNIIVEREEIPPNTPPTNPHVQEGRAEIDYSTPEYERPPASCDIHYMWVSNNSRMNNSDVEGEGDEGEGEGEEIQLYSPVQMRIQMQGICWYSFPSSSCFQGTLYSPCSTTGDITSEEEE